MEPFKGGGRIATFSSCLIGHFRVHSPSKIPKCGFESKGSGASSQQNCGKCFNELTELKRKCYDTPHPKNFPLRNQRGAPLLELIGNELEEDQ